MASTYENDLRLEEMATGENSGSWGTKTNTNLELVADAFSYGTETIADADTAITIADGAADAARSLALKINSSEDLTTTRVVTLGPNTTSKVWIIENNTSGGQTLTISAGSGSNITLLNGQTKIIATDGIGAGSNVVELTQDIAIADLFIDDDLSLQSDGAIINFGADADVNLTHVADTGLRLNDAMALEFRDGDLSINSSADGQLDIDADTEVQITAPTVDINASTEVNISGDLTVDTDTLYVDSTNNRVGVGTSSPAEELDISADAPSMQLSSTNASGRNYGLQSTNSGNFGFYDGTAGLNRMLIDSSGNVGIGTNSPTGKLSVSDPTYLSSAATLGSSITLNSENTGSWLGTRELISFESVGNGADHRTGTLSIKLKKGNSDTTLTEYMQINAVSNYTTFSTAATERMRINGSGNVGIGTSSPDAKLSINENIVGDLIKVTGSNATDLRIGNHALANGGIYINSQGGSGDLRLQTQGSTRMTIDSSGNVGIGTSSPAFASGKGLVIHNSTAAADTRLRLTNAANGTGLYDGLDITLGVDGSANLIGWEAQPMKFYTSATERMRIDSSGQVGIGCTPASTVSLDVQNVSVSSNNVLLRIKNPTNLEDAGLIIEGQNGGQREYKIGVNVIANSPDLTFSGPTGYRYYIGVSEAMRIDSSGNVGIGTGSPEAKLDITDSSTSSTALRVVNTEPTEDSIGSFFSSGSAYSYIGIGANETALYGRTGLVLAADNPGSGWNPIRFSTGGSERMRLDNNGNLGINNTSPNTKLDIIGSTTGGSGVVDTLRLRNTGTSVADGAKIQFTAGASTSGAGIGSGGVALNSADLRFYSGGNNERMRITSAGDVTLGSDLGTNPGYLLKLVAEGTVQLVNRTGANGTAILFQNDGVNVGSISVTDSATAFNTSSDYRLKTDAQPMTGASARVQALNPVNFEWIADGTRVDGFLAHEAQEVVPEAVTGTKDAVDADGNPEYQGIDQSKLVPLLTAALQEALTKIDALETRITALEG